MSMWKYVLMCLCVVATARAELEAVRSRRLAQCPVCAGSCISESAGVWLPCDHCNGAGVIFVDKEST